MPRHPQQILRTSPWSSRGGFTLVELLVAIAVLLSIMAIVFSITQETTKAWKSTTGKVEGFRSARAAFESMSRTISQATLNTYYDYVDSAGTFRGAGTTASGVTNFTPYGYARQSDLHFICGQGTSLLGASWAIGANNYTPFTHSIFFQAPLGVATDPNYTKLDKLMNACGFYVAYGLDPGIPAFLTAAAYPTASRRYRFRLMQFTQKSEALSIYATPAGTSPAARTWFFTPISGTPDATANAPLADNIVALVVWPKLSIGDQPSSSALTSDYSYDSRNMGLLTPPIVPILTT